FEVNTTLAGGDVGARAGLERETAEDTQDEEGKNADKLQNSVIAGVSILLCILLAVMATRENHDAGVAEKEGKKDHLGNSGVKKKSRGSKTS
ncbi:unnamed protein product, partial [Amoebophrya sp. A120]